MSTTMFFIVLCFALSVVCFLLDAFRTRNQRIKFAPLAWAFFVIAIALVLVPF